MHHTFNRERHASDSYRGSPMTPDDVDLDGIPPQHLRQSLDIANRDVCSLRSVVKTLERTVGQLQADKSQLSYELQDAKHYLHRHEDEIKRLTNITDAQNATIQRMAIEHADEMINMQQTMQKEIECLKAHVERLSGQLSLSNSGPRRDLDSGAPQPLPWHLIMKQPSHPIHIIRRVLLADQRREELGLVNISTPGEDEGSSVSHAAPLLDALLEERSSDAPHSEDDSTWRNICRRLHQVLSDRRRVHHLMLEETPTDFLLRSRSVMVSEWVALQADLSRLDRSVCGFATFLQKTLVAQGKQSVPIEPAMARRLAGDVSHHMDSLSSSMADIVMQCSKVREHCFSEVDKLLHGSCADSS